MILLLAACLLLAGCGQNAPAAPKPCEEVAAGLAEKLPSFEELTPQDRAEIVAYLGVDDDDLAESALWMDASAATTEMIAVLTAKDEAALANLRDAIGWFMEDMIETYRDYAPDEVPKLESAVLDAHGRQLVLIVSKDADAAKAALDEAWK